METPRLLRIYLNDHLAGATAAAALARRAARSNRGSDLGALLERHASDLAAEKETLLVAMQALGVRRNRAKEAAGAVAERLGRLKLNGRIVHYSPLSRLVELEGLTALEAMNRGLWESLRATPGVADRIPADLDLLAEEAARRPAELEPFRREAARIALVSD